MEDLVNPETLGVGTLGVGGVIAYALLRLSFIAGGIRNEVTAFLKDLAATNANMRQHHKDEEKHHERIENLLDRVELNTRPPRTVSGDHTPVPVSTPPPTAYHHHVKSGSR